MRRHKGSRFPVGSCARTSRSRNAIADLFRVKIGLEVASVEPAPLGVYSDPGRDDRGWTISLAHTLVLPYSSLADARGRFVPVY